MTLGSPSLNLVNDLIFGAGHDDVERVNQEESDEPEDELDPNVSDTSPSAHANNGPRPGPKRESMYITLFNTMVYAVLDNEKHLIAEDEWHYFVKYINLSEEARYLLVRLCLRKEDKWHRLDQLKYQRDIGDPAKIKQAIRELCNDGSVHEEPSEQEVKHGEPEIIDLTLDDEDDEPQLISTAAPVQTPIVEEEPEEPGLSQASSDVVDPGPLALAEDETKMENRELLECLNADELKKFAKQMKLKLNGTRATLVNALLEASSTQKTINFPVVASSSKPQKLKQTQLPFAATKIMKTQQERLREMVIKVLGKCIRVNKELFEIFRRVNLIYFRSTQHTPTLLTPSILSRSNKRFYPTYNYTRRSDIWPTRDALLAYEEALALEARVDGILEATGIGGTRGRSRSVASKTPAPGPASTSRQFRTPGTPASALKGKSKDKENLSVDEDISMDVDEDIKVETPKVQEARLVKEIFEAIFPRWKDLLKAKEEEQEGRPCALERFHCGHIYTRIICKGANALATLKEHEYELEVLEALLAQKRWRRGRRGRWYDRRALILTTHFPKDDIEITRRAMRGVVEALLDDDTHIIYRPMLQRRLGRLEKKLNVPPEERHTSAGQLLKPEAVTVEGIRIHKRASSLHLDDTGRAVNKTPLQSAGESSLRWTPRSLKPQKISTVPLKGKYEWKGKSVWRGRGGEEINVETLALQHYERLGYKGFHCEGRILCTIFGLLFWHILFADVPGAFETPYQCAPLDIAEDCFYHAREGLIKDRLDEIEQGNARRILEKIDDEHRLKGTWCVGVRWDMFEKQDLLEIVECLGGPSLSVICRLFCEDYTGRGAGVPDLIIWKAQHGECKFVEVKGPGDSLQENQKLWIDVLLRAGAEVELCHVLEKGQALRKPSAKKGASSTKTGKDKGKKKAVDSDSEQEVAVESEDDPRASPSHWKMNTGIKGKINHDELPTFTIKTRLNTASTENHSHEPIDTDNEQDELEPTPSKTNTSWLSRGTKRKVECKSPTPKSLSRSSSQRMAPEVLIMVPSPKKRRLAQSSEFI